MCTFTLPPQVAISLVCYVHYTVNYNNILDGLRMLLKTLSSQRKGPFSRKTSMVQTEQGGVKRMIKINLFVLFRVGSFIQMLMTLIIFILDFI